MTWKGGRTKLQSNKHITVEEFGEKQRNNWGNKKDQSKKKKKKTEWKRIQRKNKGLTTKRSLGGGEITPQQKTITQDQAPCAPQPPRVPPDPWPFTLVAQHLASAYNNHLADRLPSAPAQNNHLLNRNNHHSPEIPSFPAQPQHPFPPSNTTSQLAA